MNRWLQIESLFQEALDRPDPERDAFLRDACVGDPELYRAVVSLTDQNADVPSDDSWAAAAAAQLVIGSAALDPGDRLGPYEITSFIAAGGMGAVYGARDPRMGRDVAIKVCPERFKERSSGTGIAPRVWSERCSPVPRIWRRSVWLSITPSAASRTRRRSGSPKSLNSAIRSRSSTRAIRRVRRFTGAPAGRHSRGG
jgi:serine/threonine protein kinase